MPVEAPNSGRTLQVLGAFQKLEFWLGMASRRDPSQPEQRRESAKEALMGVICFLAELFPSQATLPIPLDDLLHALHDVSQGKPSPLFEPVKLGHRPPNSLSEELFKAFPAAALTLLMKAPGMKREEAAHTIARHLARLGYKDPETGPITAAHIKKWREKMMTEMASENLAVQRYDLALDLMKGRDPAEAARYVLDQLPSLHPGKFPKNPTS
jgi:hypothetical protein